MTTQEGNKIIAEFDGYEYLEGWFTNGKPKSPADIILPEELKYHSSWDWLRPAWDKFQDIDFHDFSLDSQHKKHCDKIAYAFAWLSIDHANRRLIDAIQWYNQNKEVTK